MMKEIKDLDYRSHRSFFNVIVKWPKICMIVIIVLFCIWGIVDTAVFQVEGYHYDDIKYGVMGLPNGFLNWFIWAVIGTACGLLTYVFTKLVVCYKVLVIANLEKISKITETLPPEPEKEKKSFLDN